MFEARLIEGVILKQIIDSIKDLVTDASFDISQEDMSIQCMDSSHVSLVDVNLKAAAFDHYRCDKALSLGFNSPNMSKILKMMNRDDIVILKAEDEGDVLSLMFENSQDGKTIADFELKLMDIDSESLGIPDAPYKSKIAMPSAEFQRIVRDLQTIGDTCTIAITKEGVRFSVSGPVGTGNIMLRQNAAPEKEEDRVTIDMEEPVELQFALRYLNFFTKATPLSGQVIIQMSPNVPIVVEYPIMEVGHVKFFLAPKIDDEEEEE